MQGIEKWPQLFIYCRIHKEKDRRKEKQKYEIGSLISFGINLNKPFVELSNIDMIAMTKDNKHHKFKVRRVSTLGHQI